MQSTELFERWLTERSNDARSPLSLDAAKPYRYIWRSWCKWLDKAHPQVAAANAGTGYLQATPKDVQLFLANGPSPSSTRVSKTFPISEVTRRRYWRVLDCVYQHALNKELMQKNPVRELSENDKPKSEKSEGLVLTRVHFEAMYQALPAGTTVWDVRDRAILLLLLEAALTPGEVCGVLTSQVHPDSREPSRLCLSITGARYWQSREMVLSDVASTALAAWLTIRSKITFPTEAIFVTQQHEDMSGRPLFYLVAKTVAASAVAAKLPVPYHVGPQVLRNTRIVLWLNDGIEQSEVVKLAGYKDAKSFRGLLRHIQVRVAVPKSGFKIVS